MELYIWFSITLSANILIFNFSCFLKQLPPFPCRFNFCINLCFNTWSMYSKTCPIPVKNVRDKLIEMTPLSSLLSDCIGFTKLWWRALIIICKKNSWNVVEQKFVTTWFEKNIYFRWRNVMVLLKCKEIYLMWTNIPSCLCWYIPNT